MVLHFIQLQLGNKSLGPTEVSTQGCSNVDHFKHAIKNKFSRALDAYDSYQLVLYQHDKISKIDPHTPIDHLTEIPGKPMVVTVEEWLTDVVENLHPRKRQCINRDLTARLRLFTKAKLVNGCIRSQDQVFLPYPQDEIKNLYIRKCYRDIFDLLVQNIKPNMKSFAISGTPGIGKSLFFVYILFKLLNSLCIQSHWKPKRVVYHCTENYICFDFKKKTAVRLERFDAEELVWEQETFYIIDGQATPILSSCINLFISSPRCMQYKEFVKQKKAKEWFFPVWTLSELETCRAQCYPDLSNDLLKSRFDVYGGVPRFVFDNDDSIPVSTKLESVLNDAQAVRGVQYVGKITDIFPESHALLQIQVGEDQFGNAYRFIGLDIASKYVGEQLWILHSAQMITQLQEMFGGSPNEISRHLFEIYGHLVFSAGGRTLKCRCLESGTITKLTLDAFQRKPFGKDTIPTVKNFSENYYEPSDDDTFPAIDSFSPQGMFQFTVAAEHPIRGIEILRRLCALYVEPKLYFVVPPHRFAAFKKQSFKAKRGTDDVTEMGNLKQYVLELPVI